MSHFCSESAPRFFADDQICAPARGQARQPGAQKLMQSFLADPDRWVGPDRTELQLGWNPISGDGTNGLESVTLRGLRQSFQGTGS